MKLHLPSVTMVATDTFMPERTMKALRLAADSVEFAEIVLVCLPGFVPKEPLRGLRLFYVDITDARRKREEFLVGRMAETYATPFCLHMEWDAGIGNSYSWNSDWLQYDFIGAPWPFNDNHVVGNTGFALMSKAFNQATSEVADLHCDELDTSDYYMCRTLRPTLEKRFIRFAPKEVAAKFSCENVPYVEQFGWHGKETAKLNGWVL